jgi:serine beta-lactamase-like protein LACTB
MLRKISLAGFLAALVWFLWPVYQYLAYEGKVPMLLPKDIMPPDYTPRSTLFSVHPQSTAALDLLEQHKNKIRAPAVSAAVAVDGKIVWAGATGWANIEAQIPATADTRFRIGSTSKAVTATLLAKMVQAGKIDPDISIAHYLSDLPNPAWENITIRQLASHSSGLPDYIDNYGDLWGFYYLFKLNKRYTSVRDSFEIFDDTALLFEPGNQYHYTSFNTVLLSAVLEAVVGSPFPDAMHREIFTPLGMTATGAEYETFLQGSLAEFYWNRDGQHPAFRTWQKVDLSHRLAGGGFTSTPSDLVKLGSAWLNNEFITQEIREMFWQPQALNDGSIPPENYALGWRWTSYEDAEGKVHNANHGGVSRGSQCWLMVIPEKNMAVAVTINSNVKTFRDFWQVSMPLARLFFGGD